MLHSGKKNQGVLWVRKNANSLIFWSVNPCNVNALITTTLIGFLKKSLIYSKHLDFSVLFFFFSFLAKGQLLIIRNCQLTLKTRNSQKQKIWHLWLEVHPLSTPMEWRYCTALATRGPTVCSRPYQHPSSMEQDATGVSVHVSNSCAVTLIGLPFWSH